VKGATLVLDLSDPIQARLDARLREETAAYFVTVRPDGRPHARPVWFLWDGATVLIFSQPGDVKIRNLSQNPQVALALDNFGNVSMPVVVEGTAALVEVETVQAQLPAYEAKYVALAQRLHLPWEQLAQAYTQPIRVTPTKIRRDL
jgi:PPOX class probable F420-dependent enzyme